MTRLLLFVFSQSDARKWSYLGWYIFNTLHFFWVTPKSWLKDIAVQNANITIFSSISKP